MKIYEYRVIVPVNIEKYQIGNRYMNLQYVKDDSVSGEGIELVKNEKYTKGNESGQYTYKIFHVSSKIPSFIRWALPEKYLHFHEESWNSFPHYYTVDFIPALGENFVLNVESQHIPYKNGMEFPENALNLSKDELDKRKIFYCDIVNGDVSDDKIDLNGFECKEANIQKLNGKKGSWKADEVPEWTKNYDGEMICCIKVVKFHFKYYGLQGTVENMLTNKNYPKIFTESHRKLISSAKEWYHLTEENILALENEAKSKQNNDDKFEKDD